MTYVIAEIGNNHNGNFNLAKKSIQFQLAQIAGITPSQHIWVVDEITNTVTIQNFGTCKL